MDKARQLAALLRDTAQSASNAIAGNVAGPVDLIGMGLNKIGVPVGDSPVGGSNWMKQQGFMRDVEQGPARVIGETAGMLGPAMVTQFAPQIARGALGAMDNAMAPRTLSSQAGIIKRPDVVFKSVSDSPEKWASKQAADYSGFEEILNKDGLRLLHKNVDDQGFGDLVAMKNGRVVGTTFYGPHGANPSSKTLEAAVEVDPAFRRQGIATSMYDAIEKLKNNRFTPAESNTPLAEAFWQNRMAGGQ